MLFQLIDRVLGSAPDPQKMILRELAKALRGQAHAGRPDAAQHAARHFLDAFFPGPEIQESDAIVALYAAKGTELSTHPLADALHQKGIEIALPVIEKQARPLVFKRYTPGDKLTEGAFGIETPTGEAPTMTPSLVVAPLLAFSRGGGRLGYGGGFYDRTLAKLRRAGPVTAIGYAYGAQEVDALPTGRLDEPLDWIVTERGAFRTGS